MCSKILRCCRVCSSRKRRSRDRLDCKVTSGIMSTTKTTYSSFEDKKSCIKMIESEKDSNRTKHADIKFHAIKHLKGT